MSKKNYNDYKKFDIDLYRPKVLLLGNGLCYATGIPWTTLIHSVAKSDVNLSLYEQPSSVDSCHQFAVPNTILALAISENNDSDRHKKYQSVLSTVKYMENPLLSEIVSMPLDAILTTNYTYELEVALRPNYPFLANASKRKYASSTTDQLDSKFLLHTYNRVQRNSPDIWHIHGELRCPNSMILTHDEYARLIHRILDYNKKRGNNYQNYRNDLKFKSWIDYFLLGDVYILGFGMDFSEFDLWWLLGRRMREKVGAGQIVFYEPAKEELRPKHAALRDIGVSVRSLGINIQNCSDYNRFYKAAICDIRTELGATN